MTTDDLPPLPDSVPVATHLPTGVRMYGYTADMMRDYARAAVEAERERIADEWSDRIQSATEGGAPWLREREVETLKREWPLLWSFGDWLAKREGATE